MAWNGPAAAAEEVVALTISAKVALRSPASCAARAVLVWTNRSRSCTIASVSRRATLAFSDRPRYFGRGATSRDGGGGGAISLSRVVARAIRMAKFCCWFCF